MAEKDKDEKPTTTPDEAECKKLLKSISAYKGHCNCKLTAFDIIYNTANPSMTPLGKVTQTLEEVEKAVFKFQYVTLAEEGILPSPEVQQQ